MPVTSLSLTGFFIFKHEHHFEPDTKLTKLLTPL